MTTERFDWRVTANLGKGRPQLQEKFSSYESARFVATAAAHTSPFNTAVITCPHGKREIIRVDEAGAVTTMQDPGEQLTIDQELEREEVG